MSPTVNLRYGANIGDGLVGVGWGLEAAGMIARTGPRGGLSVAPAAPDGFELDGEPLIACAPGSVSPSCTTAIAAFGSSAGFYSTRRESFARIYHAGGTGDWTVWSTGGEVARYVTYDSGQRWMLTSATDVHGNAIEYDYACSPGAECELARIRYGDHVVRGAEIRFYY